MTTQTRYIHRRRRHAVISTTIIAIAATAGSAAGGLEAATTEPVGTEPAGTEPAGTEPAGTDSGETDYQWTPNEELLAGAEGQVNIVSWAGYVVDGSGGEGVDWVTPFEDLTGCTVNNALRHPTAARGTLM